MWNVKMLTGEQWRAPVGQRVLLAPNPDNQPDQTTIGQLSVQVKMPMHGDDTKTLSPASTNTPSQRLHPRSGSLNSIRPIIAAIVGNRLDEFLVMEAVGKAGPIKKPKGDDPSAPEYATV